MMLVLSVSSLPAKQHPVPLEPNVDSAKCIECHEDKSKGKFVHSAVATGCTSCHEVRVNKDATYVKLTKSTSGALCLSCHADKNAADLKGQVHSPAVRDCVKCHDPHESDNKYQLLKPASGEKNQNLCLTCHSNGLNVPAKGSRHAALDTGCETCHVTHKTGERGKPEYDYHLTKAAPALCIECHDLKSADLVKAHQGQPFATANCIQCHNPHQSRSPKLLQAYTHAPFEGGSCDACHAPAKDGKVVLTQQDVKSICVTCHSEQAEKIEKAKFQHAGAQGECVACHNPHAGKTPGFLQPDPVSACTACHTDIADLESKKTLHQPAFQQGCATCHEPHGGDNEKLLRAKGNVLCMECHGRDSKPTELKDSHQVAIFNGKIRLPEDYFTKYKVTILQVKNGKGHPTPSHPVEDIRDINDLTKLTVQINCQVCHQPHASAGKALLAKDQNPDLAFCQSCHKGGIGMN